MRSGYRKGRTMRFRPCIDIHNGKVRQIVGGSLRDEGDAANVNFDSAKSADYYAEMYRRDGLLGGHIILLNPPSSEYYKETLRQAKLALCAYPKGMQIGGGVTAENAESYLEMGASHVIVTSYVFQGGEIRMENLERLCHKVGKERIVLDLSCRKKEASYYIVTDRWQTFTQVKLTEELLRELGAYCGEFLVHGVDVEGKASGVDASLAGILAGYAGNPVTYAGGIGSREDLETFKKLTGGKVDFTVGSALDIFGGTLPYDEVKLYKSVELNQG